MSRAARFAVRLQTRALPCAMAFIIGAGVAAAVPRPASASDATTPAMVGARTPAVPAAGSAPAGTPGSMARAPQMMGLSLGMPIEAAVRTVQAIAPPGSVTLPALRRDPVTIVRIEVPVALAAPASDAPKDDNFYVMLNSASRILKSQASRSSHVPFVTLVASDHDRRLVRIVFEPAFVHWPEGYDAGRRTAWSLADRLRELYGVDVELASENARRPAGASGSTGRVGPPPSGWALRVNAARKSVVLSDVRQLPDEFASRLQLD